MPMFSFDIGFNEAEIKAKVISQRDGKNKQYVEKEEKDVHFSTEQAIRFLVYRRLEVLSAKIMAAEGEAHADMKFKHLI